MVTIVDYGAGNLRSVLLALAHLGFEADITSEPSAVLDAERIIFPGVGAVGSAMRRLSGAGLSSALIEVVARGTPFLGICLGAQIIFQRSEEDGGTDGLGLLPGLVKAFGRERSRQTGFKIPHMGWNDICFKRSHPLLDGIKDGSEFYFVHGYYIAPADTRDAVATTEYAGEIFASIIGRDNLAACQFHPERSGRIGLKLLENFIHWNGESC